ncbi:hypothetical protein Milano_120 [Agrobacterium phage Milano]|nr:hypothetical protein Milano_120 [Agrobacterium phage Milano]
MTVIRNPFKRGQSVELTKGFPSVGLKAGDRLIVKSTSYGFTPGKTCPKGIRPTCGFDEIKNARIPTEYLKA